ncbi:MAG: M15 family metallopeptidase [Alphaproteobacteria bacterium]
MTLFPFADCPVPSLRPAILPTVARAYVPVDLSDPRASEKLVDVKELGVRSESYYARTDGGNAPYNGPVVGSIPKILLRESVAKRVAQANKTLAKAGLALFALDGYRSLETQVGLWNFFWERIAKENPAFSKAEIEQRTLTFVSDPRDFKRDDPHSWPLHSTGGAVDLTLCRTSGALLDLGTDFDATSDMAATAWFEGALARGEIAADDQRLLLRRTLYWTMRNVGFTNYINEWWHFDWGDQLYVLTLDLMGEPLQSGAAWYGYTEPEAA